MYLKLNLSYNIIKTLLPYYESAVCKHLNWVIFYKCSYVN